VGEFTPVYTVWFEAMTDGLRVRRATHCNRLLLCILVKARFTTFLWR